MPDDAAPELVHLTHAGGEVACRYWPVAGSRRAALWVGGVGGGWDTPACELYPRLAGDLTADGIASLRVRFRHPTRLGESVAEVAAGLDYLIENGAGAIGLIGHSFGGAVVIRAAAACSRVHTVVTLASQSYGTEAVSGLAPRCSLLLVHGTADAILPPSCSQSLYERAGEPKRLILHEGAGHMLEEAAGAIYHDVRIWLIAELRGPRPVASA